MKVSVFCGSPTGSSPAHVAVARDLGALLAERGHVLVYGGTRIGLMGELADCVLAGGGSVRGIITDTLVARGQLHPTVDDVMVVGTLEARKTALFEEGDAVIALPGGIGTLDEVFTVLALFQMSSERKPFGLLNVGGYYDALLRMLEVSIQEGFVDRADCQMILTGPDPAELLMAVTSRVP